WTRCSPTPSQRPTPPRRWRRGSTPSSSPTSSRSSASAGPPSSRRGGGRLLRREALWFYVLISPWLVHFLALSLPPILTSPSLSLTQYDTVNPAQFVGGDNYRRMLVEDPLFLQSLKVTTIWTAVGLPLRLIVALVLAVLLNQKLPGVGVFRTIYYLPSVVSGV